MPSEERLAEIVRELARGADVRAPEDGELPVLSSAINELAAAIAQKEELLVAACRGAETNLRVADTIAMKVTDEREEDRKRYAESIRAMGLPLIEVATGVLVVPIVGLLDSGRAGGLLTEILDRCHAKQARYVIVELTAIDIVDTQTADHLLKIASAAGMLGTKLFFTGIQADIASTMIALGVDMRAVRTFRTVKDALAAIGVR